MKVLVGAINQEKALIGAFSVIVKSSRTFGYLRLKLYPIYCSVVTIPGGGRSHEDPCTLSPDQRGPTKYKFLVSDLDVRIWQFFSWPGDRYGAVLVLAGRHPVSDDRLMLNKFLKQLIEEITWGFLAFDIDTVMNTHTMHWLATFPCCKDLLSACFHTFRDSIKWVF